MNARITTRASVIVLFLSIAERNGSAKLLTTPLDTEVRINDSVYLNCSTSNSSLKIHWYHNDKYVYGGGNFYSPYYGRFEMTRSAIGEYNLFIPSAQPEDAGQYKCKDHEGSGQSYSVELTVLAANPVCAPHVKPGIIGPNTCNIKPEEVQLSCSVAFYGQPPKMEWRSLENQNPLSNVSCETNGSHLTCNVTMKSDQNLDGSVYVCRTTRATPEQYKCTTEATRIMYFTRNFVVMEKTLNDNVTCTVDTSLQSYNIAWKFTDGDREVTVANNQTHELNASGLYRCEVKYNIRNYDCFDAVAFFYVSKQCPNAENGADSSKTCAVYMGLMITFILAFATANVVCIIFMARLKQKRKRRRGAREENALLNQDTHTTDEKTTQLAPNTDLDLYKTQNQEMQEKINLIIKDLQLHEKKIHDLEEKHGTQSLEWKKEKEILIQRQLENDKLLFRNRKGKIEYLQEPTLIEIIKSETNETKTKEGYDERIYGLAILNNEILTIRRLANEFQVFGLTDFKFIRTCPVKEMLNPRNIVSCSNKQCLYIIDWKYGGQPKEILKVDASGSLLIEENWQIADECGHMSVTPEFNVILPLTKRRLLREYTSDGKLIREIYISDDSGIMNPLHVVKLSSGHFVISHGDVGEEQHRVCVINANGNLLKAYGGRKGWTDSQMDGPAYLALDEDENILVVDRNNMRVLLLSSNLEFKRELLYGKKHSLIEPWRVCLDSTQGRLLVANNNLSRGTGQFHDGQVLVFSVYKMS